MDVAYLRAVFATAQERNEIIFTEFGISTFRRFPATLIRVIEVYFPQIFFEWDLMITMLCKEGALLLKKKKKNARHENMFLGAHIHLLVVKLTCFHIH